MVAKRQAGTRIDLFQDFTQIQREDIREKIKIFRRQRGLERGVFSLSGNYKDHNFVH